MNCVSFSTKKFLLLLLNFHSSYDKAIRRLDFSKMRQQERSLEVLENLEYDNKPTNGNVEVYIYCKFTFCRIIKVTKVYTVILFSFGLFTPTTNFPYQQPVRWSHFCLNRDPRNFTWQNVSPIDLFDLYLYDHGLKSVNKSQHFVRKETNPVRMVNFVNVFNFSKYFEEQKY